MLFLVSLKQRLVLIRYAIRRHMVGDAAMELSSEQKEYFGKYISNFIRENLKVWITESALNQWMIERETEIRERIVRVEESLDKHIELTRKGFEQVERRFEQVDMRLEQIDMRFKQIDMRFEQVERRFEQVDRRFELVDRRFDQVDKRFNQMFAYFTTGIVMLGLLITSFQIFG